MNRARPEGLDKVRPATLREALQRGPLERLRVVAGDQGEYAIVIVNNALQTVPTPPQQARKGKPQ